MSSFIFGKNREFSQAEKKLDAAISAAKKLGNPYQVWRTHHDLGKLKEARDFNQEAKAQYGKALQVIEKIGSNLKDKKIQKILLNSDLVLEIKNKVEKYE